MQVHVCAGKSFDAEGTPLDISQRKGKGVVQISFSCCQWGDAEQRCQMV